ncbi:GNAT family N-acetyltransferase [Sulfurimonas sp. HSL-1716]|uniref:GNAT family N-acetyltransferase n=1 Tax=Hydrocurvibacter sulfurireducens TaxID=3131937 RepID=UPI0031F874FB
MKETITIHRAKENDAHVVAKFVEKLLEEIMQKINTNAFNFDLEQTTKRLEEFIKSEKNFVFIAKEEEKIRGFISVYESFALYAEGAFGTIAELYVCPKYRSQGIGKMLIEKVKIFGSERGWKRLEVTTPPLPQFDETLSFYEKESFEITGGRKMKTML